MNAHSSLILDLTGSVKTWSWQFILRNNSNESVARDIAIPQEVTPALIYSSFHRQAHGIDIMQLQQWGIELFNQLFPQSLQEKLNHCIGSDLLFRVPPSWADIPFDLCYIPDKGFLGLIFCIGTTIILHNDATKPAISSKRDTCKPKPYERLFILADPAENLPSAHEEGLRLKNFAGKKGLLTHFISRADKHKVLDSITRASFVHFAGHSLCNGNAGHIGWEIGRGSVLSSDDIQTLRHYPSVPWLIFSNSCHGGSCGGNEIIGGIAGAFLIAGIPQFIGPIQKVNDNEACEFAIYFYRQLFKKRYLFKRIRPAKLLHNARKEMTKHKPSCTTPLFYRLYGDPCYSLRRRLPDWRYWLGHVHNLTMTCISAICIIALLLLWKNFHHDLYRLMPQLLQSAIPSSQKNAIAALSERAWDKRIAGYRKNNLFIEKPDVEYLVANVNNSSGKYMIFPQIDFRKTFPDSYNNKYYYYRPPNTLNMFMFRENPSLTDKLMLYSSVIGNLDNAQCTFLGKITGAKIIPLEDNDQISQISGNNVRRMARNVFMETDAVYILKKVAVVMENGTCKIVAGDILEKQIAHLEKNAYRNIPRNTTKIPLSAAPLTIAKLFFYRGNVQKQYTLWQDCITQQQRQSLEMIENWWSEVSRSTNHYIFTRQTTNSKEKKEFYFLCKQKGAYLSKPVIVSVRLVNEQWRVDGFYP